MLHLLDSRRAEGRRYVGEPREDGTGYYGQINQFPVICAADFIEQPVTMRSRREDVVTTDPARVRCADCKERIRG